MLSFFVNKKTNLAKFFFEPKHLQTHKSVFCSKGHPDFTHLLLDNGKLNVLPPDRSTFLHHYFADLFDGQGESADRRVSPQFFICETLGPSLSFCFHPFLEIDLLFDHRTSDVEDAIHRLDRAGNSCGVSFVRALCDGFATAITLCFGFAFKEDLLINVLTPQGNLESERTKKYGYHLVCPNVFINCTEMKFLAKLVVEILDFKYKPLLSYAHISAPSFNNIIDVAPYKINGSLRMPYSYKSTQCNHDGTIGRHCTKCYRGKIMLERYYGLSQKMKFRCKTAYVVDNGQFLLEMDPKSLMLTKCTEIIELAFHNKMTPDQPLFEDFEKSTLRTRHKKEVDLEKFKLFGLSNKMNLPSSFIALSQDPVVGQALSCSSRKGYWKNDRFVHLGFLKDRFISIVSLPPGSFINKSIKNILSERSFKITLSGNKTKDIPKRDNSRHILGISEMVAKCVEVKNQSSKGKSVVEQIMGSQSTESHSSIIVKQLPIHSQADFEYILCAFTGKKPKFQNSSSMSSANRNQTTSQMFSKEENVFDHKYFARRNCLHIVYVMKPC